MAQITTMAPAITTTIDGSGIADPPPPPLETKVSVSESLSKSISEGSNIDPDPLAVRTIPNDCPSRAGLTPALLKVTVNSWKLPRTLGHVTVVSLRREFRTVPPASSVMLEPLHPRPGARTPVSFLKPSHAVSV